MNAQLILASSVDSVPITQLAALADKILEVALRQRLEVTRSAGPTPHSCLFYVTDRITGTQFFVDTGADASVLPPARGVLLCKLSTPLPLLPSEKNL